MRAVELFCGAGGMSRGLVDAGFDVVGAFDHWPVAVETYRRNVNPHARVADLSDLLATIPEIIKLAPDAIVGGPPCQDYSSAGRRQEGRNASLTIAFAIIIATVRPEWFLMENVVTASKSEAWIEARSILKKAGYGISESRIKAEFYGVPQARRRLFVCGRLGERDGFLASAIARAACEKPMTLRDLFQTSGPSVIRFNSRISTSYAYDPGDAAVIENGYVYSRPVRAGRGVRSVDEPFPTVTRTAWERPTPRYLSAPHPADAVAATDTAVLTIEQLSRIQGFPPTWEWVASAKRDRLQMIANAVPPAVAQRIGAVILARHYDETSPEIEGQFLDWLVRRGRTRATARNVKALLGRARRLLCGRTFADPIAEIAYLEVVPEFSVLSKGTRSDLRQTLRLYAEFQNAKKARRKARVVGETSFDVRLKDAA